MVNSYINKLTTDFYNFAKSNLPPQNVAGMSVTSGKWLYTSEHIAQQIKDLLLSPIGSIIMYPNYGSNVVYYIDMPITEVATELKIEVLEALKYEDRISLINTSLSIGNLGQIEFSIEYAIKTTGEVNTTNVS